MTVEPSYRIDWQAINALTVDEWVEMASMYQGGYMNEPLEGYIELDTRLQAIADAHEAVVLGRQTGDYQWEAVAIKQRDTLLDALNEDNRRCPDGGACHHSCTDKCYRVECCGPLSGVFPNDEWPDALTEEDNE